MKNAEELQNDINFILGAKAHFPEITLEDIEEQTRNLNPHEGFSTDVLKGLLTAIAKYNKLRKELENRLAIFPGIIKFFGPIANPGIRLINETAEIKEIIASVNQRLFELNFIIIGNLRRISNINVDIYLQNILEDQTLYEERLSMLAKYKYAIDSYQIAIDNLSNKLDAQRDNIANTTETDLTVLLKGFDEIRLLKEEAIKQQITYHYTLEKEACNFVLFQYSEAISLEQMFEADAQKGMVDSKEQYEKKENKEREELCYTENAGKYEWLKNLIEAYKDEFNNREREKTLNLKVPEELRSPAQQLIEFILHVLNNPNHYDINVKKIVQIAIAKVGNDISNLDAAFNTDENKKYGVLKSLQSKDLLKDLEDFIAKKLNPDSHKNLTRLGI